MGGAATGAAAGARAAEHRGAGAVLPEILLLTADEPDCIGAWNDGEPPRAARDGRRRGDTRPSGSAACGLRAPLRVLRCVPRLRRRRRPVGSAMPPRRSNSRCSSVSGAGWTPCSGRPGSRPVKARRRSFSGMCCSGSPGCWTRAGTPSAPRRCGCRTGGLLRGLRLGLPPVSPAATSSAGATRWTGRRCRRGCVCRRASAARGARISGECVRGSLGGRSRRLPRRAPRPPHLRRTRRLG